MIISVVGWVTHACHDQCDATPAATIPGAENRCRYYVTLNLK